MKLGRKITGGRYVKRSKKKKDERQGQRRIVKLGEEKRKTKRIKGGNVKTFLLKSKEINLEENGKIKKTQIKNVIETPSNRFFARQNILTKGTIIETELGKAKITNRPSQEGNINGTLIKN